MSRGKSTPLGQDSNIKDVQKQRNVSLSKIQRRQLSPEVEERGVGFSSNNLFGNLVQLELFFSGKQPTAAVFET